MSSESNYSLGPTHDGGYYALGLNSEKFSSKPEDLLTLFTSIRWSSEYTYDDTLAAADSIHLIFTAMPTLYDIDYLTDWHRALDSKQGYLLQQKLSEIEQK